MRRSAGPRASLRGLTQTLPNSARPGCSSVAAPPQSEGSRLIRGALARVVRVRHDDRALSPVDCVDHRDLGVSRFGQYATVISVTLLVLTVTDSDMTNFASREYALLQGTERDKTLNSLLGMLVASAATIPLIILHPLSIPLTNEL